MSSMWSAIDIAGTGVNVDQTWIDTISGNIANMNDAVTPGQPVYRAESVVAGASGQPSNSSTPRRRCRGSGQRHNPWSLGGGHPARPEQPDRQRPGGSWCTRSSTSAAS